MEREWVSMTLLDTERFVKNYQQNSRIEYRGILNGKKKKRKRKKKRIEVFCEKFRRLFFLFPFLFCRRRKLNLKMSRRAHGGSSGE